MEPESQRLEGDGSSGIDSAVHDLSSSSEGEKLEDSCMRCCHPIRACNGAKYEFCSNCIENVENVELSEVKKSLERLEEKFNAQNLAAEAAAKAAMQDNGKVAQVTHQNRIFVKGSQ